ncbi:MAG: hypothetical protein AAFU85_16425 [Planctomycetota bacterium]
MAIKQVTCPKCQASMNVMATMTSVQCQSCGHVFPTAVPQPAAPAQSATAPESTDDDQDDASKMMMWTIIGGAGAVFFFAVAIIAAFQFVGDGSAERAAREMTAEQKKEARREKIAEDAAPYVPTTEDGKYVVVEKLAESTRKRIYREHVEMLERSFGRASKVPKGGAIGKALGGTIGGIIEREIERLTLAYGISKEEYANVIAEGEAKQW